MSDQHSTTLSVNTQAKPRKGPRPSAETIRKRVTFLIGSGNVKELDEAGYVVVPRDMLANVRDELNDYVPAQLGGNGTSEVASE